MSANLINRTFTSGIGLVCDQLNTKAELISLPNGFVSIDDDAGGNVGVNVSQKESSPFASYVNVQSSTLTSPGIALSYGGMAHRNDGAGNFNTEFYNRTGAGAPRGVITIKSDSSIELGSATDTTPTVSVLGDVGGVATLGQVYDTVFNPPLDTVEDNSWQVAGVPGPSSASTNAGGTVLADNATLSITAGKVYTLSWSGFLYGTATAGEQQLILTFAGIPGSPLILAGGVQTTTKQYTSGSLTFQAPASAGTSFTLAPRGVGVGGGDVITCDLNSWYLMEVNAL